MSECSSSEYASAWPKHRTAGLVSGVTMMIAPAKRAVVAAQQACKEPPLKVNE